MIANNSKHVVLAAWQALASRDPARIGAMFTADAEWLAPQGNATAVALNGTSRMIGREQIAQSFGSDIWKLFTANVKVEFRGVYADGDVVIVEERMQATLANGNAYDNDYCFVFEVENGLIRRVREYMDTAKGHRMIFATDRSKS
ncbi:MAG: nuclear transport factor 2 family protein [Xanthobacteraceae bacterium]